VVVRDVVGEIELLVGGKRYFIVGKGAGASMRGIKRNRKRPDLIILDDIINDELVMNRLRVDRLNRWFYKALLPSLSPDGDIYVVGTPLSQNDLFMKLCSLHPTVEFPLTDTAWPDRFTPEWIETKKREYSDAGMLREFKQEYSLVLTDDETKLFDTSKLQFIDSVPDGVNWYLSCDLAFSDKDTADYSALAAVGIDSSGMFYCYPVQGRWKPSDVAGKIWQLVQQFNILDVGIETGPSFITVEEYLLEMMNDYGNYFNLIELKHQGKSKHSRISRLEPLINSRRLTLIDMPGLCTEELVEQMELTDRVACMAEHDDILDALAYMLDLEMHYYDKGEITRDDYIEMMRPRPNLYD
jgi:hypothetical protein